MRLLYEHQATCFISGRCLSKANKLELLFLGYGLEFVEHVNNIFNVQLSFHERGIIFAEDFSGSAYRAYKSGLLGDDDLLHYANLIAGYVGLLIKFHKGGIWVERCEAGMHDSGPAMRLPNGGVHFVLCKSYHHLLTGIEDSLLSFYQSLDYPFAACPYAAP